jgi:DNA mismatch repair protein MutS
LLKELCDGLDVLDDVYDMIDAAIVDEPPITIKEGGIIKLGYNEELDKYKKASTEGKQWIIDIEAKEKEATGIKNLKVGFTKVFGYYIEVTKSFLSQVPDRYIRKQTLTGCERYITEELKKLEEDILGAEEKSVDLEYNLFIELRSKIAMQIERIQKSAYVVST